MTTAPLRKFSTRLIGTVVALSVLTLGGAMPVIYLTVYAFEKRQLDARLVSHAREVASGLPGHAALTTPDLGHSPASIEDELDTRTHYAVVYLPGGGIAAHTAAFGRRAPAWSALPTSTASAPFDLRVRDENVRAVLVPIPSIPGAHLLLAVALSNLEAEAGFLARTLFSVLLVALAWSILMTRWVMQRLLRHHQAITDTVRQVAAGNLSARVPPPQAASDVDQLARDVNEMIARIESLVEGQKRFIAHASHELRSPLTLIYGELSNALRRARDADEYRLAIQEALDSTRELRRTAEQLLTLARVGAEAPRSRLPVDLLAVARRAAQSARELHPGRNVVLRVAGDPVSVMGSQDDLERMVLNLTDNAIRHSPPRGTVLLDVARVEGLARLIVSDDGPGVAAIDADRIFEPFYRSDRDRAEDPGGTGLGLTIVREIAVAHRGEVRLDPSLAAGAGACFVVDLPCAPAGAPG